MGVQLQVRLSPLQAAWVRALVQVLLKAGGSPGLSVQLPAPGNTFFCAIGFLYTQNVWGILVLNPASACDFTEGMDTYYTAVHRGGKGTSSSGRRWRHSAPHSPRHRRIDGICHGRVVDIAPEVVGAAMALG